MKYIFFLLFVALGSAFPDHKRLRCIVCRATVEEMSKEIESVNPKKKIQVGGYRLDGSGNLEQKLVPFARSGMHLSELMDTICKKLENYVRATDKNTGKLVLIKLITDDGAMNPNIDKFDLIQDSDLNKSLNFYCEGIVEEFEDEIYNVLKEPSSDPVSSICSEATKLCESTDKDEL